MRITRICRHFPNKTKVELEDGSIKYIHRSLAVVGTDVNRKPKSMGGLKCHDSSSATITMNKTEKAGFRIGGIMNFKCYDKDGNLKWEENQHNLVVNEGLDNVLDVYLSDGAQTATMYIGLKGTGSVAAGDTLASHAGWSEFSSYTGDRQAWVEAGVSSQSIDNSASPAAFPITGSGTVAGAFMCTVSSGTGGTLFAAVDFAASRSVSNGDTINVTYTISAADDGA